MQVIVFFCQIHLNSWNIIYIYLLYCTLMQLDPELAHDRGHRLWVKQLGHLNTSIQELTDTNPSNIIEHFFSKAMPQDFPTEDWAFKATIKKVLSMALARPLAPPTTIRECAASIVAQSYSVLFVTNIRLADIRNLAVFQVYCKCGVTVDTYFERFSSPPGTTDENREYAAVAHGNAECNAETTKLLSDVLLFMQYVKRVLLIKQCLEKKDFQTTPYTLNWIGTMWSAHIKEQNLSLLIWELFLDLHYYKAAAISFR